MSDNGCSSISSNASLEVDPKCQNKVSKATSWAKWSNHRRLRKMFQMPNAKQAKRRKVAATDSSSSEKQSKLFRFFDTSNLNKKSASNHLPNGRINHENQSTINAKVQKKIKKNPADTNFDDNVNYFHDDKLPLPLKVNGFMLENSENEHSVVVENGNQGGNISSDDQIYQSSASKDTKKKLKYKLRRRNSSEQFTHLGLLAPAFILHPAIQREHILTKTLSDKLGEDLHLKLAAAHINDAMNGRGKFGEARAIFKSSHIQRCFQIISSSWWAVLLYITIITHGTMLFFEQPENATYIGSNWSPWRVHPVIPVIDALCLVVYIIDITLHILFFNWRNIRFAKEALWIRVEIVFTCLFIIDFAIFLAQTVTNIRLICPFRFLRASMLLCKSKNVSHIFNVLLSIISKLGKVLIIIAIFLITFASVGLHIFMNYYHGLIEECPSAAALNGTCTNIYEGAFDNVAIAALHLFVLMSTENYPEFIIPAFSKSWANFFYFGIFLYAGVFFLTAILLAIIVESYWDYSKRHVKQERRQQREELVKAWNLMDPLGKGQLSTNDTSLLKLFRILKPKNTNDENLELIGYISVYDDGFIDSFDWTTKLIETLSFEFEEEPAQQSNLHFDVCGSSFCNIFRKVSKRIIHANAVSVTILVLILIHSVLFCLMWNGISREAQLGLQLSRTSIVALFFLEVIFRILADGKELLNVFDILDMMMILFAVAGNIAWYVLWFTQSEPEPIHLGACVVVSGLSVLIRAVFNSQHARSAVHILRNIYPVMFDLILLVLTIIFGFAVLGFELFQDKKLSASVARGYEGSYLEYGCNVGFDTFGCSLLIVFQIVTTNDWQEIMLGAMLDAGWASAFYFGACFLIVDMIVINLFVAISIEAYKKLAIDNTSLPNNNTDKDRNATVPSASHKKDESSFTAAARSTLGEIFATSRKSKANDTSNTLTGYAASPFAVRRGTLGSLGGPRTPTPSPRPGDRGSSPQPVISLTSGMGRFENDDVESEATPPLPGGLKQRSMERRQMELKKRQQRKKETRKTKLEEVVEPQYKLQINDVVNLKRMVRVIKPFRAQKPDEMNVNEGEVVFISGEERDSMLLGPKGWFPVANVVEDGGRQQSTSESIVSSSVTSPSLSGLKDTPKMQPRVHFDIGATEKKVRQMSPRHRVSQTRMIRKTDGADWRRDIHGDMTVMNKDEMQDLSRMIRGGLERRHTSRLRNLPSQFSLGAREELREEDEEEATLPQVMVSEVKVDAPEEEMNNTTITSDTNTLTLPVPQPRPPRHISKQKAKPSGDGSMPEWMQKFVAEKQIPLDNDVKLDESAPSSGDERRPNEELPGRKRKRAAPET